MRGLVLALSAVLIAALGVAVPAQAVEAEVWVFLYADQESQTGTYEPSQTSSAPGIKAEVTRTSEGNYDVPIAGAGKYRGVPMVTAVGGDGVHCQIRQFSASDSTESVTVGCYRGTQFVDSRFTLTFFSSSQPDSGAAGAYGYVYDNRPTLTTYAKPPASYNSTGGRVEIHYDATEAMWTVHFLGEAFRNIAGNVQVVSVGTMPARCAVVQWYPSELGADAQVRCDSPSGPSRPQWTLGYAHNRSIVGGTSGFFGYLQADQPTSPAYTPNTDRNLAPNGLVHTVSRSGPGRYQAQIYGPLKEGVAVHLSVNGDTDAFCNLTHLVVTPDVQPAARVDLTCFTSAGVPADNWYSLNYYSP